MPTPTSEAIADKQTIKQKNNDMKSLCSETCNSDAFVGEKTLLTSVALVALSGACLDPSKT
eukprot:3987594-Amphidinium_carterae.1